MRYFDGFVLFNLVFLSLAHSAGLISGGSLRRLLSRLVRITHDLLSMGNSHNTLCDLPAFHCDDLGLQILSLLINLLSKDLG